MWIFPKKRLGHMAPNATPFMLVLGTPMNTFFSCFKALLCDSRRVYGVHLQVRVAYVLRFIDIMQTEDRPYGFSPSPALSLPSNRLLICQPERHGLSSFSRLSQTCHWYYAPCNRLDPFIQDKRLTLMLPVNDGTSLNQLQLR